MVYKKSLKNFSIDIEFRIIIEREGDQNEENIIENIYEFSTL